MQELCCKAFDNTRAHTHAEEVEAVISSTAQTGGNFDQNPKETELVVLIKAYRDLRKVAAQEKTKQQQKTP